MTDALNVICSACGAKNGILEKVGFREVCSSCDAWMHACVNCRFWEKNSCTEPSAEKVRDPEGQNFCEWFKGREPLDSARDRKAEGRREEREATNSKAAAEEMWKKLTGKGS
jgi:hypothetical protein